MILSPRPFQPEEPTEESKLLLIICEGGNREPEYFRYFASMDSRVNLQIVPAQTGDNNSPTGLWTKYRSLTEWGRDGQRPEYELAPGDEVWFVIDTDKWGQKITELKALAEPEDKHFVAISNPCFEVWLGYHFSSERYELIGQNLSARWKSFLPDSIFPGGFNSRRHPLLIRQAIDNAKAAYEEESGHPLNGCTNVFRLAESIYTILSSKIDSAYHRAHKAE